MPVAAAAAMGAPILPTVAATSLGVGTEDASRPIEEEYGEYRPETVIPAAVAQSVLETAIGPEASAARVLRGKIVKRLSKPVVKRAVQGFAEEASTEGLQNFIAQQAKLWSEGERDLFFSMSPEEQSNMWAEAGVGGAVGAILGGGSTAVGTSLQVAGEEAQKLQMKQMFKDQAGRDIENRSYAERLPPTVDEARQVLTESAPEFLLLEGREELGDVGTDHLVRRYAEH